MYNLAASPRRARRRVQPRARRKARLISQDAALWPTDSKPIYPTRDIPLLYGYVVRLDVVFL